MDTNVAYEAWAKKLSDFYHPLVGCEWNSPYGRQKIQCVINYPTGAMVEVLTPENGEIRNYSITRIGEIIIQDEYRLTDEYAQEQVKLKKRRELAREREEQERVEAERQDKEITIFTNKMPPREAGLARKLLLTNITRGGVIYTRKTLIEKLVSEGWKIEGNNLTHPNGENYISGSKFTKIGMRYAAYLISLHES